MPRSWHYYTWVVYHPPVKEEVLSLQELHPCQYTFDIHCYSKHIYCICIFFWVLLLIYFICVLKWMSSSDMVWPLCWFLLTVFNVLDFLGKVLYQEKSPKGSKNKINGGFLSSTKRFSQPRDVMVKKTDTNNPGLDLLFIIYKSVEECFSYTYFYLKGSSYHNLHHGLERSCVVVINEV